MEKLKCPTTALFNKFLATFGRKLEKAETMKNFCETGCFNGRIQEKIRKRLEHDKVLKEDIKRGVIKNLSIMFADIRGFTTRTSMMHPDRIVQLLDLIIPEMLNIIIERHKGMVDKLLGDGIMAVYGHPYKTGEEVIQAIYSAIDMQQATAAMDQVLKISGYDPVSIGIGINYGEVLICEVGNDKYRESTVIGAPVNVAAKMEDIAKSYEISMPAVLQPEIEKLKPVLVQYLQPAGILHGIDVMNLNWIAYLENEQKDVADWEIQT
jgi:class 3 adenylate cyclase